MLGTNILDKLRRERNKSVLGAQSHYENGVRLAEQNRYPDALVEFKEAIRAKPGFWEAQLELGITYDRMGRTNEAIKAYFAALETQPDLVKCYQNLGLAYDNLGEFVKALKMYLKAIRLRPNDLELRKNLGLAYFNMGSYAEAIKAYKQALRIAPNDATVHYSLGLVYLDLEDKNSVLEEHRLLKELGHNDFASLLLDEIDRQAWRLARVSDGAQNPSPISRFGREKSKFRRSNEGFSVIELLIVVSIITVVSGFALMQITHARQVMARENAARLFASFLEKARIDSLRRHPMNSAQMAQVEIVNASFYTVAIDSDGDGILNAPQVVSLPPNSNLQFNLPYPRSIYFNWRGRTVDASGNIATPAFVTISSSVSDSSRIDLSTAGQPTLEGLPATAPVANSVAPAPDFRPNTQIQ